MGKKRTYKRKKSSGPKVSTGQRLLDKIRDLLNEPDAEKWIAHYMVKPTLPMNIRYRNSKKPRYYRGINWFWLSLMSAAKGYDSNLWLTMKQANQMGGKIRKGEKATMVVFWKFYERQSEDEETGEIKLRRAVIMRSYNVFNVAQTENIDYDKPVAEEVPGDDEVDGAFADLPGLDKAALKINLLFDPPEFRHDKGVIPHYVPARDEIVMPPPSGFDGPEHYMLTKLHEYAHSTGHPRRLNRVGFDRMIGENIQVRHDRGMEEMVAELAATLMAAEFGIEVPDMTVNASRYIRSWQKALDDSKRAESLITACQQAQKVCDYVVSGGEAEAIAGEEAEVAPAPATAAIAG